MVILIACSVGCWCGVDAHKPESDMSPVYLCVRHVFWLLSNGSFLGEGGHLRLIMFTVSVSGVFL